MRRGHHRRSRHKLAYISILLYILKDLAKEERFHGKGNKRTKNIYSQTSLPHQSRVTGRYETAKKMTSAERDKPTENAVVMVSAYLDHQAGNLFLTKELKNQAMGMPVHKYEKLYGAR